jgi:hypothetical protein
MKRYEDDDGPLDRFGVLKDGRTATVGMMMRDSSSRVTDALHRPGFRVGDAEVRDAKQLARDAYEKDLTEAWRGDDARKKKTVTRDPEGRLLSEEEEELEDALPTRKGMTLDQMRAAHEQRMSVIYGAYDSSIREQFRRKP